MSQGHSRYPVTRGQPYDALPFETQGKLRGEMYLDVDVAMAKDFLAHSRGNRRIRDERVAELARLMRSGSYTPMVRGKAFKFDQQGYLCDGHHTAFAIILAAQDDIQDGVLVAKGVSAVSAGVVWGVTDQEIRQLDTNVDRTYADVLGVDGLPNAREIAPLVRRAISWDHGYLIDRGHYHPSFAEQDEYLDQDRDKFESAIKLAAPILSPKGHSGIYSPSAVRFHLYLLLRLEENETQENIGQWVNALVSDSDSWVTRNVLRNITDAKISKNKNSPYAQSGYQLGLLNEAFNRFAGGRTQSNITLGILTNKINSKDDYPYPGM